MTNTIKTMALLVIVILMSSFANNNSGECAGTYAVSASDPSQIKLTINTDHTFYYQDFSVLDKRIVVNGSWSQKGNKLILKNNDSEKKFHHVWTFDKNGQVVKSRKGLSFYRLCKINQ